MSETKEIDVKKFLPSVSVSIINESEKEYEIRVWTEDKPQADFLLRFTHAQGICLIGQLKALFRD